VTGDEIVTDIAPAPESTTVYSDTPEEREFELRAAIGSYWTGGRLFIGMFAFLLASEAFAYFYLRSSNNGQLWRPQNQTAPTGIGWAIFVVVLVSAAIAIFGHSRLRKGSVLDWEVAGWTAVLGGLLATGLQIWQLTQLPFFPGASGYASCFIGWAVMNIIMLLTGTYWLETTLARSLRMRTAATADGLDQVATTAPGQIFRANVAACTYFWGFMAGGSALFWMMFYLI
jgi:heme/copper-type cytochrome/quinol oxidase subunit 3